MKFSKDLDSQCIPEWRKAYINYKSLKRKLKQVERFRKYKERKAAFRLNQVFQEVVPHSNNKDYYHSYVNHWDSSRNEHNTSSSVDSSKFYKMDMTERCHHRPLSRQCSVRSASTTLSVLDEVLAHASTSEKNFFNSLDTELDKVSRFYNEKETEAKFKLEALKGQMQFITDYGHHLMSMEPNQEFIAPNHNPHIPRYRLYSWFPYHDQNDQQQQQQQQQHSRMTKGYHHDSDTLPRSHHVYDYVDDQRITYNVARNRLKKAITEYYRSLEFLKSYKTLNETGFYKILKKFDKTAGWRASNLYSLILKKHHWISTPEVDSLISETEKLYIDEFADGHRRRGMRKLRVLEKEEDYHSSTLRIGLLLGISFALLSQTLRFVFDPKTYKLLPNVQTNMQIYACFIIPILFCLCFTFNLIAWHRSRINYKFIFELDPRHNLDYHQFAELPAVLLCVSSLITFLDFSQYLSPSIPSELYPLILFVILLSILLCPFDILYFSSRKWFGVALVRIALSYCFPVEFRDFFIADELNSLSYSIWTSSYFFCAYSCHWIDLSSNCNMAQAWVAPVLASLPPWWRLLQCLRRYRDSTEKIHLLNAAKYMSSIMAAIITGLKRMYPSSLMTVCCVLIYLFNSIYTSCWDIKMDWGLLQPKSQYFLLRDELVFHRWTYYTAVPINILLRFSWILSVTNLRVNNLLLSVIVALLEVYRRIQWNFFRLENEHINNCAQYRAIKEIPLPFKLTDNKHHFKTELTNDDEERISILSSSSSANKLYTNPNGNEYYQQRPACSPMATAKRMIPTSSPPHQHHHSLHNINYDDTNTNQVDILSSPCCYADSNASHRGSYYGRRDFENKQDDISDLRIGSFHSHHQLGRRSSTISHVLTRIKSMTDFSAEDTDAEDDDYDDEDDDECQDDSQMHNNEHF